VKSTPDIADIVSLLHQPWIKKLSLATALATLLSDPALGQTNIIADSVADYSITQGYKNWYYGYCVGSYAPKGFTQFNENFNCCGLGDAWQTDQNVWTAMWQWGGTPNGLDGNGGKMAVLEVCVRRWVSTTEGNITIVGDTSSCDAPGVTCNGGDTTSEIYVDGALVFSQPVTQSALTPYSVNATVTNGSFVDFSTRCTDTSEVNGGTTFSGQITQLALTVGNQTLSVEQNAPANVTLTSSGGNGNPPTYQIVSSPSNGELTGTPPNLTYTPDPDFVGNDTFTFKANDGSQDSNIGTVTVHVNTLLVVQLFHQYDTPWGTTYLNDDPLATMQKSGCAVTSLAMALTYAGVTINPGQLNQLMTDEGDFTDADGTDWLPATKDASGDSALRFHFNATTDPAYLSETLADGYPIIVGVNLNAQGMPSHFVLVTGEQDGQFLINDPGHAGNFNLSAYGNQFVTRGYVGDPSGDVSELNISIGNNAELLLTDPIGRNTGYDPVSGNILQEIPQSAYFSDVLEDDPSGVILTNDISHFITVFQPTNGQYQILLTGINYASYTVGSSTFARNGARQIKTLETGNIAPNATQSFSATVASTAPAFRKLEGSFLTNGAFQLTFTGLVDTTNIIEVSSNVVNWSQLATLYTTNGFIQYQDSSAIGHSERFYRIEILQP
jgi:hypothetical protein